MEEYTNSQVALIQRFCNLYRSAPEIITLGDRFVGFSLSQQERTDIETLVQREVAEQKTVGMGINATTFYRLADKALADIGRLRQEGRLVFQ